MSLAALKVLATSDPNVFAESIKNYGLEVLGKRNNNPLQTQVQEESVASIASALTEDVHTFRQMSADTRRAKNIAEQYGYIVQLV
jgi:hypothetical protein